MAALYERQLAAHDAAVKRRENAWDALEPSFRDRVASGEVVLEGLQSAPTLATARSAIPSLWARLLIFDAGSNRVSTTVQNVEFIDVTAYHSVQRVNAVTIAAVLTTPWTEADAANPPRPRGRTSYNALIESDLRANLEEVRRRAAQNPGQRPNWSELARAMHKRLTKQQRSGGGQIPHVETIRTRLPDIYARLLSKKPVRK
ncbi:hypothetical protein ACFQX4_17100 [Roseomonas sp. GCM10028921]